MTLAELYPLSVLVLAALLFLPVNNIIRLLRVRRLQRKLGRELDAQENARQERRARFITLVVVLIFAYLFTTHLLKKLYE